jgi:hypothetical protein
VPTPRRPGKPTRGTPAMTTTPSDHAPLVIDIDLACVEK